MTSELADQVPVWTTGACPGWARVKVWVLPEKASVTVAPWATTSMRRLEAATLTNSAFVARHVPSSVWAVGALGFEPSSSQAGARMTAATSDATMIRIEDSPGA